MIIRDVHQFINKATRPDGTPIRIENVRIDKKLTEVGVRTGSVGFWDQIVSRQIQDLIEERLSSNLTNIIDPQEC
jgi:hypothetical protein